VTSLRWLVALAGLVALALAPARGFAQERILLFDAAIAIQPDGSLRVTETIEVEALGQRIQRGILRDFPTDYRDRLGNAVTVPFDVEAVTRNGNAEPWRSERLNNGVRVRIGSADTLLPRGRQRYEIRYRTARQLGFFERHDELYWNVTGTGWNFAIDAVQARVTLPRPVPAAELRSEAFTGAQGARERDYRAGITDGAFEFATTRRLAPREGLTIVAMFPKGIVPPPTAADRVRAWIADNAGGVVAIAGAFAALLVLAWRWHRVGRDPRAGPAFPRYDPPDGMSAAAVRFVRRMGFDNRCFAAGVLGLGSRGYLTVHQNGDTFGVERTGRDVPWLAGDKPLADALFGGGRATVISKTYDASVASAQNALKSALERHYADPVFRRNRGSLAFGALIGVAALVAGGVLGAAPLLMIVVGFVLVAALVAFARWMPAYTGPGRKLIDHIDGLRQYLSVAERDDLARMQSLGSRAWGAHAPTGRPPDPTPAEFARMLPYALALGVEKTWADRFATVLGAAAVAAAVSHYYQGFGDGDAGSIGALSDSLDSMASTVAAASTPPGSSSGSSDGGGGGGSSGGGGGGGGGDGW
jgi:uncharacterized membrane protein YgcG